MFYFIVTIAAIIASLGPLVGLATRSFEVALIVTALGLIVPFVMGVGTIESDMARLLQHGPRG